MQMKNVAQKLADQGRYGDTLLAHISPQEAAILRFLGGSGTINPKTGLPEFWGFGGFFSSVFSPITEAISDVASGVGDVVEDVAGGVGGLIEDTASNVGSVVNQVTESPLLPLVANYFVPGSGAYIAAVQTIDNGGSLEDAIKNGAIAQVAGQVGGQVGAETGSSIVGGSAAGATGAALTGGDILQGGLLGGVSTGVQQGIGSAYDFATQQPQPQPQTTTEIPVLDGGMFTGQGEGAFPGATTGTVASDAGIQTLSPVLSAIISETPILNLAPTSIETGGLLTGQGEGAFPGAVEGTVASDAGVQVLSPGLSTTVNETPVLTESGGMLAGQGEGAFPGLTEGTVASDVGGNIGIGLPTDSLSPTGSNDDQVKRFLQRFLGSQIMATLTDDITSGLSTPAGVQGLLGGAGSLIGSAQENEARQRIADMIRNAGQAAAGQASFRPVGITTRFGASQFQFNPQTGQLESAGYTTSPEFQALQNRLMGLAGTGLTQAEQAQAEFAPLTGAAQGLFGLGQQYLARSPQDVAQQYVERQQALLQPERERQLATIRNRLQRTGRTGLSVAQGGDLAASNPELQAYYNALAQQNLQLAAQGEQAGQQAAQFGAGLFGTGANILGQRYAGQQAALTPFSQYLTGVSDIERLGQQPLSLSSDLGRLMASAGGTAGQLGLRANLGAADVLFPSYRYSPLSSILGGLSTNAIANQIGANALGRLFGTIGSGTGGLQGMSSDTYQGILDYLRQNPQDMSAFRDEYGNIIYGED